MSVSVSVSVSVVKEAEEMEAVVVARAMARERARPLAEEKAGRAVEGRAVAGEAIGASSEGMMAVDRTKVVGTNAAAAMPPPAEDQARVRATPQTTAGHAPG